MINAMRKFQELLQIIFKTQTVETINACKSAIGKHYFLQLFNSIFARKTMQILTITDNFISSLFLLAPHVTLILWYSVSPGDFCYEIGRHP